MGYSRDVFAVGDAAGRRIKQPGTSTKPLRLRCFLMKSTARLEES
jgi:hypothetical protein